MSDVRHYARAREHLEGDMNQASDLAAALNAQLAVSVAVRELCGELRNSLQGINGRLHDVASALEPDAGLVWLHSKCAISPTHVTAVTVTDGGDVEVHTTQSKYTLRGLDAHDVAMKLGVSA